MQSRDIAEMNLSLGEPPTVTLEGPDPWGGYVDLAEYRGRESVLAYFYPLDERDAPPEALIELEERLDDLEREDVALVVVAGDAFSLRKEDLGDIAVPILQDRDYEIGQALGLFRGYKESAPERALILLDKEGHVAAAWHDTGKPGLVEDVMRTVRAH